MMLAFQPTLATNLLIVLAVAVVVGVPILIGKLANTRDRKKK